MRLRYAKIRTRPPRLRAVRRILRENSRQRLSFNNILDISAARIRSPTWANRPLRSKAHQSLRRRNGSRSTRSLEKAFAPTNSAIRWRYHLQSTDHGRLAKAISEIFSEVIIAPEFEADARALLQKKKNLSSFVCSRLCPMQNRTRSALSSRRPSRSGPRLTDDLKEWKTKWERNVRQTSMRWRRCVSVGAWSST